MDTVSLRVPREAGFLSLLHLVLGGIGLRHNLSFDALDDLQLAVDSILAEDSETLDDLSMGVGIGADSLLITLEPLRDRDLRSTLEHGQVPAGAESRCIDVCILLRSLVDGYSVSELEDGAYRVELRKRAG
ncbi:MAG: hypothetical protein M5U22_03175 [Thermoleophilia bacterium]|nr:hypothetical protein [Thermoleophilia bacterium]